MKFKNKSTPLAKYLMNESASSPPSMLRILNQGIGIEVEVERFPNAIIPMDVTVKWELKNDGSLRNNGKEFINRFG
jgi:hypothetical protein